MCAALLIAIGCAAQSTSADAYFNQASKEYVKQDKITALRTLDNGLRQYPGDPRLLKLAEELIKEDEQQQQKDQQQQDQEKDKQDQQQKDKQKGDQQKQDQQQQKQEQQKEQDQQAEKQEQRNAEKGDEKDRQPRVGTIAPQDALRMLDALERSEEDVQEKVRTKLRPLVRRPIEKDW